MPLKKLLLASVATPVLALATVAVPAHAKTATAQSATSRNMPLLLAQAESDVPVEEEAAPAPAAEAAKPAPAEEAAPKKSEPEPAQAEAPAPEPEVKPAPAEEPAPEPEAKPAPAEEAAPKKSEPAPAQAEEPAPEAETKPAPAEKPAPEPEAKAAPAEDAAPEPKAEPAPADEPKADQAPATEAAPEPKPEAAPDAEAEPKPADEPAPQADAPAAPKSEPAPAAKDEAAPEPKPAKNADEADTSNADRAKPDSTAPAQPEAETKGGSDAAAKDEPKKKKPPESAPEDNGSAAESGSQSDASAPDDAGAQDQNAEDGKRTGGKKRRRNRDNAEGAETPEENAPAANAGNKGDSGNANAQSQQTDANRQPEMLEVPNGAPVLDSAKDSQRANEEANDNNGDRRNRRERRQLKAGTPPPPPGVDFDGSQDNRRDYRRDVEIRPADNQRGKRRRDRPEFRLPDNFDVRDRTDDRVILQFGNRTIIQNDDNGRLARRSKDVYYEDLPGGHTRQVVTRPNGVRVVTIRNRRGTILQRSRFGRNGRETVLIYAPDYDRGDHDTFRDPGEYLPPLRITEPVDEYILDATSADESDYVRFLNQPPVEEAERVYTLDEVKYSARVRDKLPRVDLDTITFETGSAAIGPDGVDRLGGLADALDQIINDDPSETFLIEGHTDAVGSEESNLLLSDQRAESVAEVLTEDFDVPPENLVTQGYGERYLKVDTEGAERLNRRVTVRRITPLVRPVARN